MPYFENLPIRAINPDTTAPITLGDPENVLTPKDLDVVQKYIGVNLMNLSNDSPYRTDALCDVPQVSADKARTLKSHIDDVLQNDTQVYPPFVVTRQLVDGGYLVIHSPQYARLLNDTYAVLKNSYFAANYASRHAAAGMHTTNRIVELCGGIALPIVETITYLAMGQTNFVALGVLGAGAVLAGKYGGQYASHSIQQRWLEQGYNRVVRKLSLLDPTSPTVKASSVGYLHISWDTGFSEPNSAAQQFRDALYDYSPKRTATLETVSRAVIELSGLAEQFELQARQDDNVLTKQAVEAKKNMLADTIEARLKVFATEMRALRSQYRREQNTAKLESHTKKQLDDIENTLLDFASKANPDDDKPFDENIAGIHKVALWVAERLESDEIRLGLKHNVIMTTLKIMVKDFSEAYPHAMFDHGVPLDELIQEAYKFLQKNITNKRYLPNTFEQFREIYFGKIDAQNTSGLSTWKTLPVGPVAKNPQQTSSEPL